MDDILHSMPNEQLVAYIRNELGRGISRDEIIRACIKVGWSIQDINATFASFTPSVSNISDDTPTKSADVPLVPQQTNIAIGANTYHRPIQIFVRIWNSEISMAFLLALMLGVIVYINLSTWDTVRDLLQQDSFSIKLLYYSVVPIVLPIEYFIYQVARFPLPIHVLYYPPAVLIVWTAILYIPIILTRRLFPNISRIIKYTPSFFIVGVFAATMLFPVFDTKSRDEAFLEKCLGPDSTSSRCFQDFIEHKIIVDLFPLLDDLRDLKGKALADERYAFKGNALIDKHIEYCFSLPGKLVDARLLRYQFPSLSDRQLCLFFLIDFLESNDRFMLSLQDFMNRFPQTPNSDHQPDARKYFCEKVYGQGATRENGQDYSTCMQPRLLRML